MGLMDLFKKETKTQKVVKTVKKMVKVIGPKEPSIKEILFGKPPRVKKITVNYGGRDDDFD